MDQESLPPFFFSQVSVIIEIMILLCGQIHTLRPFYLKYTIIRERISYINPLTTQWITEPLK